ncbi:DUF3187 family protein [Oligoflexus tunisiensis]|uniref:DUF3187 family protein n=1 Tax=Oligoflexus tunisiensis TaxID=708132 RepID=UPI00159F1563|nr:DUF3187 family protein [Oligoflexus tunisiensis]
MAFLLPGLTQAGEGPLLTRSEAVGQLFRLNPPLQNPSVLERGRLRFALSRTYANLWARDKRYVVDGEIVDDQAHMAAGLGAGFQIGLGFSSRRFVQADTDQTAISFHDLFRMGQDGRLQTGKHHTRFVIPDYNLQYNRDNLDRTFSEQATVDLSYAILSRERHGWDLTATLLAAYEMASFSPYASGSVDRGLILGALYQGSMLTYFANIRQLFFDQSQEVRVGTRAENRGFAVGANYPLPDDQQLIFQFMNNQPVFRDLGQLSRNSYEWQLGYRYHWEAVTLELAVIENIFWLYNSPDWGFSLGLHAPVN